MNAPVNIQFVKHRDRERGSVLIIVMVVCIGLVSVALLFGHSMAMAYRGSVSDLAGRQSQRAIDGAVQYAEYLMINSGSNAASSSRRREHFERRSSTSGTSGTAARRGLSAPGPDDLPERGRGGGGRHVLVHRRADPTTNGTSSQWTTNASSNTPTFGLVDEASKLNINTASATMLQNLPNMTPSLAQAIVAWRTSGGSGHVGGGSASTTSSSLRGSHQGRPL